MLTRIAAVLAALSTIVALALPIRAQDTPEDLRAVHQLAAFATVRVSVGSLMGSGWLLQQTVPRPVVLTNGHVATRVGARVQIDYYQGSGATAASTAGEVLWMSSNIDLAIIRLLDDPPTTVRALTIEPGDVVRGERIVLGGHPQGLPFQTTEGVVTGALPEVPSTARCGDARNCIVVDAASFAGSSGGPAVNARGHVVGMLWGGPASGLETLGGSLPAWIQNPSFAFLIHARTIEQELTAFATRRHVATAD